MVLSKDGIYSSGNPIQGGLMDSMRKTVAVVDDENDILDLVSFQLERAGFNAKCFSNASEFLDSLKETLPDLVVIDLMLTGTTLMGNPACWIHSYR
jgi:CheY-like chemotaxis protein